MKTYKNLVFYRGPGPAPAPADDEAAWATGEAADGFEEPSKCTRRGSHHGIRCPWAPQSRGGAWAPQLYENHIFNKKYQHISKTSRKIEKKAKNNANKFKNAQKVKLLG